jgi:hypothetical protein
MPLDAGRLGTNAIVLTLHRLLSGQTLDIRSEYRLAESATRLLARLPGHGRSRPADAARLCNHRGSHASATLGEVWATIIFAFDGDRESDADVPTAQAESTAVSP